VDLDWSAGNLLGLTAGALILGVGAFILVARPNAWLNRGFFLLALADGGSTVIFVLRNMTTDPVLRVYLMSVYWYFFIAFLAALALFGLLFPRPLFGDDARGWLVASALAPAGVLVGAYAWDHTLFWAPVVRPGGDVAFLYTPLGNLLLAAFVGATALVIVKLAYGLVHDRAASWRRQGAYVLGGMVVAYVPYFTTSFVAYALVNPQFYFLTRADVGLLYALFGVLGLVALAVAVVVLRLDDDAFRAERRFLLAAFAAVLALTLASAAVPTGLVADLLQNVALLAYPILLGYAIVRFEVFDIDARVRRVAAATLGGLVAAGAFIVLENAFEGVLQENLAGILPGEFAAGSLAAIGATILWSPVSKGADKLGRRLFPDLKGEARRRRQLEIYRHGLEGALADGILVDRESRTLQALRESLGVTDAEHAAMVAEITSRDRREAAVATAA